jgi:uncharacterized protein (DUF488 family)
MHSTICTIGFAGKTAEEFFSLLGEAHVKKVIDIREKRVGQLSGFAKFPDIAFFLERVGGIAYAYEPALAPSPEIRRTYRQTKDWSAYESAFLQLMRDRTIPERLQPADFEGTVALLCSEPGPEKCHRRLVAEILAERWRAQGHTVEIRHLLTPERAGMRRKPAAGL